MAKTVASVTIMDYNDGVTLISRISANHGDTVAYDNFPIKYNPDWSSTALVLTPSGFVAGKSEDIVPTSKTSNHKWYFRQMGTSNWSEIITTTADCTINSTSHSLSVDSMRFFDATHSSVEFKFAYDYLDPTLNITINQEVTKTFTRVDNGVSLIIARIYSTDGEQFKNKGIPASITLKAELVRGTTTDTTGLSYKWEDVTGTAKTVGTDSSSFNITADSVDSYAQYRCTITDTDVNSDTHSETWTSNTITILDLVDPYQAVITADKGFIIKNGAGSTTLTCTVYQNGTEVTSDLTYTWSAVDSKGTKITLDSTKIHSKSFLVTNDLVDATATFKCTID